MKTDIKKLDKSRIEITGEIPAERFDSYKDKALKKLGQSMEIPGFRKGNAPLEIIEKNVSAKYLLEEMAELALEVAYPDIIVKHKIDPIGHPSITITKVAHGNPFSFTLTTAVVPDITLPEYKKIAKKHTPEKVALTEKEIEDAITEIRTMRAKQTSEKTSADTKESTETKETPELPPLDDAFVQSLGQFKDVSEFKEKLKENMILEKEREQESKRRMAIIEDILKDATIDIPDVLTDAEIEKMLARFKSDISTSGLSFEDYLKHIKKTEEDIRTEWRGDAEKRAKIEMILGKIAADEKLEPEEKDIERELAHLKEHHKDIDEARARAYLAHILMNEKVFAFLLSQK